MPILVKKKNLKSVTSHSRLQKCKDLTKPPTSTRKVIMKMLIANKMGFLLEEIKAVPN